MRGINHKILLIAAILTLFVSGCAGTKGSSKVLQPVDKTIELSAYEKLEINATAMKGVAIRHYEKDRIVDLIKAKAWEISTDQFKEICTKCENESDLLLEVTITRYEKGSAAARFILVGLGQIHIDADVSLIEKSTGTILAKSKASKTFAWGGIYGGATGIEDVEPAFAEAIVDILKQDKKSEKEIKRAKQREGSKTQG